MYLLILKKLRELVECSELAPPHLSLSWPVRATGQSVQSGSAGLCVSEWL